MKRVFLALALVLTSGVVFSTAISPAAYAESDASCDAYVVAMPAWYNGMMTRSSSGDCEFEGLKSTSEPDKIDFSRTGFKIGANVVRCLLIASMYVAIFFVIKGGVAYIYSTGSPEGVAGAKKTVQNALIGFVIAMLAVQIVNVIGDII